MSTACNGRSEVIDGILTMPECQEKEGHAQWVTRAAQGLMTLSIEWIGLSQRFQGGAHSGIGGKVGD